MRKLLALALLSAIIFSILYVASLLSPEFFERKIFIKKRNNVVEALKNADNKELEEAKIFAEEKLNANNELGNAFLLAEWLRENKKYIASRIGAEKPLKVEEFLKSEGGACFDFAYFNILALLASGVNEAYYIVIDFEDNNIEHAVASVRSLNDFYIIDHGLVPLPWEKYCNYWSFFRNKRILQGKIYRARYINSKIIIEDLNEIIKCPNAQFITQRKVLSNVKTLVKQLLCPFVTEIEKLDKEAENYCKCIRSKKQCKIDAEGFSMVKVSLVEMMPLILYDDKIAGIIIGNRFKQIQEISKNMRYYGIAPCVIKKELEVAGITKRSDNIAIVIILAE